MAVEPVPPSAHTPTLSKSANAASEGSTLAPSPQSGSTLVSQSNAQTTEINCLWSMVVTVVMFPINMIKKLVCALICVLTGGYFCGGEPAPEQMRKELAAVKTPEEMQQFLKKHPAVKKDMVDKQVAVLVSTYTVDPEAARTWKEQNPKKIQEAQGQVEEWLKTADATFIQSYLQTLTV